MRKLEVIDFLRGFAIFTIVLMHCVQGYLDGGGLKLRALAVREYMCLYCAAALGCICLISTNRWGDDGQAENLAYSVGYDGRFGIVGIDGMEWRLLEAV